MRKRFLSGFRSALPAPAASAAPAALNAPKESSALNRVSVLQRQRKGKAIIGWLCLLLGVAGVCGAQPVLASGVRGHVLEGSFGGPGSGPAAPPSDPRIDMTDSIGYSRSTDWLLTWHPAIGYR